MIKKFLCKGLFLEKYHAHCISSWQKCSNLLDCPHLGSPQLPAETQITSRQRTLSSVGEAVPLPSTMFSDH